jgi:isopentenyl-diphosphate delta-isomerase
MNEWVVLVDDNDSETGIMPKLEAHEKGVLHRAFSVFIFNSKGEMLLQQRATNKYHSGGLWTNACCSHPRQGESVTDAANRRLMEEMGLKCALTETFSFIYKAALEHGLTEYEYDHVLAGVTDEKPAINLSEVSGYKYVTKEGLKYDMAALPEAYTEWFKICINEHWDKIFNN